MASTTKALAIGIPVAAVTGAVVGIWIYRLWTRKEQFAQQIVNRGERLSLKEIYIVETTGEWEKVFPLMQQDLKTYKVIGFDTEWVTYFPEVPGKPLWVTSVLRGKRKPVSLVQIATESGLCVLVRLHKLNPVPDSFKAILADKGILKVGVAVCYDAQLLREQHDLCVRGCVDLQYLAARSRTFQHINKGGLNGLSQGVLGVTLDKRRVIRCSNWEAEPLSYEQIQYAAMDALVGLRIFTTLVQDKLQRRPEGYTEKEVWQKALSICQGIVDVRFSSKTRTMLRNDQVITKPKPYRCFYCVNEYETFKGIIDHLCMQHSTDPIRYRRRENLDKKHVYTTKFLPNVIQWELESAGMKITISPSEKDTLIVKSTNPLYQMDETVYSLKPEVDSPSEEDIPVEPKLPKSHKSPNKASRAYSVRKDPLYMNCQLWAPDGQLLCTCDDKKAQWYIDKGLGEKVQDHPFAVQLTFEPSGRPQSEADYYLTDKENICVVCGADKSYIRKNIVPKEYRKHFPSVMKDHRSHDIVLLCTSCHQRSNFHDIALRELLALKCDAPISSDKGVKYVQDLTVQKVRSAGKALLTSADQLPEKRKLELESAVRDYFGVTELDAELLETASHLDSKVPASGFVPHGQKVVQYMVENEGLISFEKTWRQHFLDTMDPKHLPPLWSVDHSHERLEGMNTSIQQAQNVK